MCVVWVCSVGFCYRLTLRVCVIVCPVTLGYGLILWVYVRYVLWIWIVNFCCGFILFVYIMCFCHWFNAVVLS